MKNSGIQKELRVAPLFLPVDGSKSRWLGESGAILGACSSEDTWGQIQNTLMDYIYLVDLGTVQGPQEEWEHLAVEKNVDGPTQNIFSVFPLKISLKARLCYLC